MGADVQGRQYLAGSVVHRYGNRTQPLLQFLIDNAPALLADFLQAFKQRLGGVQGATGFGLELSMGQVFVEGHIIKGCQQNTPHRRAIRRQTTAHRKVDGNQPLGGGRTGDVEDVVTFERRHVAGFVQLLAHAVQIRLGRHRQWCRRQIGMAEGQHFGQQGIGPAIGGGIAQFDQRIQATPYSGARDLGSMADLRNRQVPFTFLKRLHHGQTTGQRGHEVGVAGKRLNTFGR